MSDIGMVEMTQDVKNHIKKSPKVKTFIFSNITGREFFRSENCLEMKSHLETAGFDVIVFPSHQRSGYLDLLIQRPLKSSL